MKLYPQNPPHIRSRESNQTIMTDVMIAIMPLYAMAVYFYGMRPLYLLLISMITSIVTGFCCTLLRKRIPNIHDLSNLVTAMIVPLLFPATVQLEIVVAATVFALAVVKYPFGGVGQNIFNPAAGGFAFAALAWSKEVFKYPMPFEKNLFDTFENIRMGDSVAHSLFVDSTPTGDILDLLLGNVSGAMGTTHVLVLLTCFLFLRVRRIAYASTTLSCLTAAFFVSWAFPVMNDNPMQSAFLEIISGHLLFVSIFLLNDPVTSPKRQIPRMIFGSMTGLLCILFRRIGTYEESIIFVLLLTNALVWNLDLLGEKIARFSRRRYIEKTNKT